MTRKKKTIQEKTLQMISEGLIIGADFAALDQWAASNPERRMITTEEQNHLRSEANERIERHQQNRM